MRMSISRISKKLHLRRKSPCWQISNFWNSLLKATHFDPMIENVQPANAAIKARQVLSALSLNHPCDMEIDDIAWARGALVKEEKLAGAEGRLVKLSGRGVITIPNNIPSTGRRRFIIAHELGHFEL